MNMLLIYRSGIARKEFNVTYDKYKGNNIHAIVENEMVMNYMKFLYKDIVFHLKEELLEDKINMKFDYIIGNPPYQYPKGVSTVKKLYIDISNKCINYLKDNGKLFFITPKAILDDGQNNTFFEYLKNHITLVDFRTNKKFNICQDVISWELSASNSHKNIKVIDENIRYDNSIYDVCEDNFIISKAILNKLSYKVNGRNKMKLFNTDKKYGIENSLLRTSKSDNDIEVYCNTKRCRIKYTDKNNIKNTETQLIIPYIGGLEEGCQITDRVTNKFFYVNKDKTDIEILKNMKAYIESKLISYGIIHFKIMKPASSYNFLSRLSEIDFSKYWSDKDLYKEFNISKSEISEIENWYKIWKYKG